MESCSSSEQVRLDLLVPHAAAARVHTSTIHHRCECHYRGRGCGPQHAAFVGQCERHWDAASGCIDKRRVARTSHWCCEWCYRGGHPSSNPLAARHPSAAANNSCFKCDRKHWCSHHPSATSTWRYKRLDHPSTATECDE